MAMNSSVSTTALSSTEYVSTTGYMSTMINSTSDSMKQYKNISEDAGTEVILALISVSIACLVLFCYIKDLIASGVCKKGYRHYDNKEIMETTESQLSAAIQSTSKKEN